MLNISKADSKSRYTTNLKDWPSCHMGELFVDCMDRLNLDSSTQTPWATQKDVLAFRAAKNLSPYHFTKIQRPQCGFSFKEYMEYALYDSQFGYYTTQKSVGVGFNTNPIKLSPLYGKWLGELIVQLWLKMLKEKMIDIDDPVDIIELGGGTGALARDILEHIQQKADSSGSGSLIERFYQQCRYTIYEISPKLRETQAETVAHLFYKIKILSGDARQPLECKGVKGVVISNELPDAFPMHKIRRSPDTSNIEVAYVVPRICNNYLYKERLFVAFQNKIKVKNLETRKRLNKFDKFMTSSLLSKDVYKSLRRLAPDQKLFDDSIVWLTNWVSYREVDEVYQFCLRHHEFIEGLKPGQEIPLNIDLAPFQKATSQMMKSGYKITIDYQFDAKFILERRECFRCYPGGYNHNFDSPPGSHDITADVSATALAVEGLLYGWRPIYFGSEKSLLLLAAHSIAAPLSQSSMDFNVLIEKKGGCENGSELPCISRPLTYRQLLIESMDKINSIPNDPSEVDPDNILLVAMTLTVAESNVKQYYHKYFQKRACLNSVFRAINKPTDSMKTAIKIVVKCLFSKNHLFSIAKQFDSLAAFDFKEVGHYFDKRQNDETNRIILLITRQLLQIYYYTEVNSKSDF